MLNAYTNARADAVRGLRPALALEAPELLWFELLDAGNIYENTYPNTHSHTFFEIHFVFSGTAVYQCENRKITLPEGRALFIPSEVPHRFDGFSGEVCKASLAFSKKEGMDLAMGTRTFSFPENVCEITDYILKVSEKRTSLSAAIIAGRVYEILQIALDNLEIFLPERENSENDARVAVAKSFIQNNLQKRITSADVAKECCLCAKQLGRIFKERTGVSVHAYIAEKRRDACIGYLLRGEKSMKEIAFLCGFENESGFASFFKRQCGMSPGNFREMHRGKSPKTVIECPEIILPGENQGDIIVS